MRITVPWQTLPWTPPNARLEWVASASSSDRNTFPLVPAFDSTQFLAMVEAHRLAKIVRTPLGRSSAAPSTAGDSVTPVPIGALLEPFSLMPHLLSATDTLPGETPIQRRHQPAGDSHFSDIEDGGSDDDWVPAATAPPTAGHTSSFLLHRRRRAADMAVDAALDAATHADAADDTSRGRKRNSTSISGPSDDDVAGGNVAVTADVTADEPAVTADNDAADIPPPKRRRSGGPARAAREVAFLAFKAYDTTDNP